MTDKPRVAPPVRKCWAKHSLTETRELACDREAEHAGQHYAETGFGTGIWFTITDPAPGVAAVSPSPDLLEQIGRAVDAWAIGDSTSNDAMKFIDAAINGKAPAVPPEPTPVGADFKRVIQREVAIRAWLQKEHPEVAVEQRHLDDGTAERAYWHYGYAVALGDVAKFMTTLELDERIGLADISAGRIRPLNEIDAELAKRRSGQ